ncbi:MAG: hypothetical protein HY094_00650 [Candidatus Melainabacteria bacterium]|nr:hypothetical protein [Candidatus Melainabacteria bacterium]
MRLSAITPNKLLGSLILGSAFFIGSQGIQAQNKDTSTKAVKNLDEGKPSIHQDKTIEKLFKEVEELKPHSKGRKAALDFLKATAISQAKSPDRNQITKKLIAIMDKNRTASNWSEIIPLVVDIMKEQAIANKKYLKSDDYDGKLFRIFLDEGVLKEFTPVLLSVFADSKKDSVELQKEATKAVLILTNVPYSKSEIGLSWHAAYLKLLVNLPDERANEVQDGLYELQEIYSFPYIKVSDNPQELLNESKPYFEEIFKKSIRYLSTNDVTKQTIGSDNLVVLQHHFDQFPDIYRMRKTFLEVNKNSVDFFNEKLNKLEKSTDDIKSTKALVKGSLALLELSKNERDYHKKFIEWLGSQVEKSINVNGEAKSNKEKQTILEIAIRDELQLIPKTHNHLELAKSLVIPYTKLIKENTELLKDGLRGYEQFKAYGDNEVNNTSIALFDAVIDGLPKLPLDEQRKLKAQIIFLPQSYYFQSDDEKTQNLMIEHLSKIYRNSQDPEDFSQLVKSMLFTESLPPNYLRTKWHPYSLYKLIDYNKEYFEKNISSIMETVKTSGDEKARITARSLLLETYKTFQNIPKLTNTSRIHIDPKKINLDTLDKLKVKTTSWYENKLERPMFETILACLENETTEVATTSKGIRYIKNENWREFNKDLSAIVCFSPRLKKDTINVLMKRLKNDKNPYNRQMTYELLGETTYSTKEWSDNSELISLLKDNFAKESPQAAYAIGRGLPSGLRPYLFIFLLQDKDALTKLDMKELSPIDNFKFDFIHVLNGDINLYKSYLSDCSFEPIFEPVKKEAKEKKKEGKIDPETFNAILRFRENAFHAISSIRYIYEEKENFALINFLENRLERLGTSKTLPETWGRETASLITLYLRASDGIVSKEGSKFFLDSRLDFLQKRFFDGVERTYEIEGQRRTYITISLFNKILESEFIELNPDENRKILQELYSRNETNEQIRKTIFKQVPKLQSNYNEMRKVFALNMLRSLCERDHSKYEDYLSYLQSIGFIESERERIVRAFLDKK